MFELKIVIASPHARNDILTKNIAGRLPVKILRIKKLDELNLVSMSNFQPHFIFFPHWSWRIPSEIYEKFECIVFHMTDLPFGRGGSPLQNMIVRGIKQTQLTALRCVAELDAGPIYLKRTLSLFGTAEEILLRANKLIEEMIVDIISHKPVAENQVGEPSYFRRRTPEESNIAQLGELEKVFDYIQMLDGEGYPSAFIETENLKIEFTRASLRLDSIIADVKITKKIL